MRVMTNRRFSWARRTSIGRAERRSFLSTAVSVSSAEILSDASLMTVVLQMADQCDELRTGWLLLVRGIRRRDFSMLGRTADGR